MVTLGCYYRLDNHEKVFSEITHPIITKILDLVPPGGYWKDLPDDLQKDVLQHIYGEV